MHSALYHGWLDHRRRLPRRHAFRYRLFMAYLDLDELDEVFRGRWLWSTRRPGLVRFDRRDHLGDPAQPLADAVRALVAERTGRRPAGPIRLLTHLRMFGYVFNPLSLYYCFDAAGQVVEAVVAEVNNTPWGERHCYVLRQDTPGARCLQAQSAKAMHVSPFQPMAVRYDWRLQTPGEVLAVHLALRPAESPGAEGVPLLGARLTLRRVPITGAALAGTLLRFPWMTAKVIAAIHWEALRLWLKRVPVFDHPARSRAARMTVAAPAATMEPRR
ncbi:MAG TPA: DUF1365 domain-containing protein [Steroidobacteraceae bacterium]|nr:DUF1365 domain-containing protein [Steroidobacteraceae bacterium]